MKENCNYKHIFTQNYNKKSNMALLEDCRNNSTK